MSGSRSPLTLYGSFRSNSSSFATLAAIRRASSRVRSLSSAYLFGAEFPGPQRQKLVEFCLDRPDDFVLEHLYQSVG